MLFYLGRGTGGNAAYPSKFPFGVTDTEREKQGESHHHEVYDLHNEVQDGFCKVGVCTHQQVTRTNLYPCAFRGYKVTNL